MGGLFFPLSQVKKHKNRVKCKRNYTKFEEVDEGDRVEKGTVNIHVAEDNSCRIVGPC